jgi:MYXO-CTERM domain-containing protein
MKKQHLLAFAVFSLSGSAACSAPSPNDSIPTIATVLTPKVVNGSPSLASQDAVLMVLTQQQMCSGTLIAPNLVLTARHCVAQGVSQDGTIQGGDLQGSELHIATGANESPMNPNIVAHGKKVYDDGSTTMESHDVALIQLDHELTGVPVAPVRPTPTTAGETVTVVGYGEDGNGQLTNGRYQRSGIAILGIGPTQLTFTPKSGPPQQVDVPSGTICTGESACHGDSGGPIFDAQGNVVGVVSGPGGHSDTCIDAPAFYSDMPSHYALISQAAASAGHPLAPPPSPDAGEGPVDGGGTKADAGGSPGGDAGGGGPVVPPSVDAGTDADPGAGGAAPNGWGNSGTTRSSGCALSPAAADTSWAFPVALVLLFGRKRRRGVVAR